jgi:hypothetical protein
MGRLGEKIVWEQGVVRNWYETHFLMVRNWYETMKKALFFDTEKSQPSLEAPLKGITLFFLLIRSEKFFLFGTKLVRN